MSKYLSEERIALKQLAIDKKLEAKLFDFYALGVPAILGECFAAYNGKSLSEMERKCLTSLGFITGIIDDLFDKNYQEKTLQELLVNPTAFRSKTTLEELLKKHLLYVNQHIALPDDFQKISNLVFQSQQASLRLKDADRTQTDALEICKAKGGYALLLYRCAIDIPISKSEYDFVFALGAWMQFGDDIFDVYDDIQEGTYTWVVQAQSVEEIKAGYKQLESKTSNLYSSTNEKPWKKIALGMARCQVAMEQFSQHSKKNWLPQHMSRSQLVCDMSLPKNIWKSLGYFSKYPK